MAFFRGKIQFITVFTVMIVAVCFFVPSFAQKNEFQPEITGVQWKYEAVTNTSDEPYDGVVAGSDRVYTAFIHWKIKGNVKGGDSFLIQLDPSLTLVSFKESQTFTIYGKEVGTLTYDKTPGKSSITVTFDKSMKNILDPNGTFEIQHYLTSESELKEKELTYTIGNSSFPYYIEFFDENTVKETLEMGKLQGSLEAENTLLWEAIINNPPPGMEQKSMFTLSNVHLKFIADISSGPFDRGRGVTVVTTDPSGKVYSTNSKTDGWDDKIKYEVLSDGSNAFSVNLKDINEGFKEPSQQRIQVFYETILPLGSHQTENYLELTFDDIVGNTKNYYNSQAWEKDNSTDNEFLKVKIYTEWERGSTRSIEGYLLANGEPAFFVNGTLVSRILLEEKETVIDNLPKKDAEGQDIDYTLTIEPAKGYVSHVEKDEDAFHVKNTFVNTSEIAVTTLFEGSKEPEQRVMVHLYQKDDFATDLAGKRVAPLIFSKNAETLKFVNLPKEISDQYNVVPEEIPFYRVSVEKNEEHYYTVRYTYEVPNDGVAMGTVEWERGPIYKPTVWLKLYRSTRVEPEPVPVDEADIKVLENGVSTARWTELVRYDADGNEYTFSVKQVDEYGNDYTPASYEKVEAGLKVFNTYLVDTIDISYSLSWNGVTSWDENDMRLRLYRRSPESFWEKVEDRPAEIVFYGQMKVEWNQLPKEDFSGNAYEYTVVLEDSYGRYISPSVIQVDVQGDDIIIRESHGDSLADDFMRRIEMIKEFYKSNLSP